MRALSAARGDLEVCRRRRDAERSSLESLCVGALQRKCRLLSNGKTPGGYRSQRQHDDDDDDDDDDDVQQVQPKEVSKEEVRAALSEFFKVHNPSKLAEVDTVAKHFQGRLEDLDGALQVQYGKGLEGFLTPRPIDKKPTCSLPPSPRKTAVSKCESVLQSHTQLEQLFLESVQEMHLPRQSYFYRSCSSSSMFGIKDVWLELLHGSVRLDFCVLDKPRGGGKMTQLGLSTDQPIHLRCKLEGVKTVDKVGADAKSEKLAGKGMGNVFELDTVDVDAQVSFSFIFDFRAKHWKASPGFQFDLVKLKTNRSIADQLLKTIVNATVPKVIKRLLEQNLPKELGTVMLDPKLVHYHNDKKKPLGLAMLCEIKLKGWPSTEEFKIDLCKTSTGQQGSRLKALAREIIDKLNLTPEQMAALGKLNAQYTSSSSSNGTRRNDQHNRGLLPLQAMSLEEFRFLQSDLFIGELVKRNRDFYYDDDDEDDDDQGSDKSHNEETDAEYTEDEEDSHEDHDDDDAEEQAQTDDDESVGSSDATKATGGDERDAHREPDVNPIRWKQYKHPEDSVDFSKEYGILIAATSGSCTPCALSAGCLRA